MAGTCRRAKGKYAYSFKRTLDCDTPAFVRNHNPLLFHDAPEVKLRHISCCPLDRNTLLSIGANVRLMLSSIPPHYALDTSSRCCRLEGDNALAKADTHTTADAKLAASSELVKTHHRQGV